MTGFQSSIAIIHFFRPSLYESEKYFSNSLSTLLKKSDYIDTKENGQFCRFPRSAVSNCLFSIHLWDERRRWTSLTSVLRVLFQSGLCFEKLSQDLVAPLSTVDTKIRPISSPSTETKFKIPIIWSPWLSSLFFRPFRFHHLHISPLWTYLEGYLSCFFFIHTFHLLFKANSFLRFPILFVRFHYFDFGFCTETLLPEEIGQTVRTWGAFSLAVSSPLISKFFTFPVF